MRIGHGYDAHRLTAGRPMILGGIKIPNDHGPEGHSDADVPVHALMDAMLGALALGDIGKLFSDADPAYKDADSMVLLRNVNQKVEEHGYRLCNADITIILQQPRLSPYIQGMRENIASVLDTSPDNISVKATTEEKMGFTGEGIGIASHAVVLLEKKT